MEQDNCFKETGFSLKRTRPRKIRKTFYTSPFLFLLLLFTFHSPPPTSALAVVHRNVVKIPHDVHPGYAIKRFGGGGATYSNDIAFQDGSPHVYHLLPNEFSTYFTILDNGLLMSTQNMSSLIDHPVSLTIREDLPDANISTTHTLQLYVLDRSSMLSFPPPEEIPHGHVLENSPVGTQISGLSPTLRPTSDPSRKLKYEIVGGDGKGLFHAITNTTGNGLRILTTKELDRETQKIYTLIIKAYDLVGVDSATVKLQIEVDDENDNGPVFQKNLYRWAIPTNTSRFSVVGTVKAEDADGDHVSYRLITSSPTFVIVPQTGEILLVNKPEDQSYQLEVQAHDILRTPSLFSNQPATVIIEVGSPEYLEGVMAQGDNDDGVVVVILDGDDDSSDNMEDQERQQERVRGPAYHRIQKRRVTRAVRPTMRKEFLESEGQPEGRLVFELTKEVEYETFKIRDENPWVTVEGNGGVRVKKKWDYEELGPEKTIDFWVTITNPGTASGKKFLKFLNRFKNLSDF